MHKVFSKRFYIFQSGEEATCRCGFNLFFSVNWSSFDRCMNSVCLYSLCAKCVFCRFTRDITSSVSIVIGRKPSFRFYENMSHTHTHASALVEIRALRLNRVIWLSMHSPHATKFHVSWMQLSQCTTNFMSVFCHICVWVRFFVRLTVASQFLDISIKSIDRKKCKQYFLLSFFISLGCAVSFVLVGVLFFCLSLFCFSIVKHRAHSVL